MALYNFPLASVDLCVLAPFLLTLSPFRTSLLQFCGSWAAKSNVIAIDKDTSRACSHYAESFDDEGEREKAEEESVEFLEAREDAAETFEPAEEPFDLVAFLVNGVIVIPGMQPVGFGRDRTTGIIPRSSTSWRVSLPS